MCCKVYIVSTTVNILLIVFNIVILILGFGMTPHLGFWGPDLITATDSNGTICLTGYYHNYYELKQEYCSMINNPCARLINISVPIHEPTMQCDTHDRIIFGLAFSLLVSSTLFFVSAIFRAGIIKNNIIGISNVIICFIFIIITASISLAVPGTFSLEAKSNGVITIKNDGIIYKTYEFYNIHEFIHMYCYVVHSDLYRKFNSLNLIVTDMIGCYSNLNYTMILYFIFLFIISAFEFILLIWKDDLDAEEPLVI